MITYLKFMVDDKLSINIIKFKAMEKLTLVEFRYKNIES